MGGYLVYRVHNNWDRGRGGRKGKEDTEFCMSRFATHEKEWGGRET